NKGLDHLKSAYKKRETYSGPWLPDAIPDSLQIWSNLMEGDSQETKLMLAESLTTSFLLLIERLSPEERVVYLLGDVLDYPFKEIAGFLDKTETACRKIAQRARKAIAVARPKFKKLTGETQAESLKVIENFFSAAKRGDVSAVMELLADGAQFWSDGGGKVAAAPRVFCERIQIANFWVHIVSTPTFKAADFKIETHRVNGMPGLVISRQVTPATWVLDTILSFEFDEMTGRI